MDTALEQLTAATNSTVPLPKALAAEQGRVSGTAQTRRAGIQIVQSRNQQSRGQQSARSAIVSNSSISSR
jgi:hypothetical protein